MPASAASSRHQELLSNFPVPSHAHAHACHADLDSKFANFELTLIVLLRPRRIGFGIGSLLLE